MESRVTTDEDGSRSVYYFDADGNDVRVEDFDPAANLVSTIQRRFPFKGVCAGWTVTDAQGEVIKRFEVVLDDNRKPVETLQFDAAGNLEQVYPEDE